MTCKECHLICAQIKCVDCRMQFSNEAELHRHRSRSFCGGPIAAPDAAKKEGRDAAGSGFLPAVPGGGAQSQSPLRSREVSTISRQDLGAYITAHGSGLAQDDQRKGLGGLKLSELQRGVNASSLADLQARARQEEQQALASKLRAYKLSGT